MDGKTVTKESQLQWVVAVNNTLVSSSKAIALSAVHPIQFVPIMVLVVLTSKSFSASTTIALLQCAMD